MAPERLPQVEARLAEWPFHLPMPTGAAFTPPAVLRPDFIRVPEVEVVDEVHFYGPPPLGG
eukprot:11147986-Alexandrium_andersonii.AAC.1